MQERPSRPRRNDRNAQVNRHAMAQDVSSKAPAFGTKIPWVVSNPATPTPPPAGQRPVPGTPKLASDALRDYGSAPVLLKIWSIAVAPCWSTGLICLR